MQENAQHRVFAIPELLALIAQCLSPRDISQWMLTCKAFSRRLEPYFWSYPVIRRDRFQLPHLARYTHHFRSLEASLDISLSLVQSVSLSPTQTTSHRLVMPEFPRLRTLTVHAYHIKDAIFLLQSRLVLYSPTLTELNLQFSFESDSLLVEHYLDLLATNLPCLQNLVVQFHSRDPAIGFRLLEVCFMLPQLTNLQCNIIMDCSLFPVIDEHGTYDPRFSGLLESLKDTDKDKMEAGQPTGLPLKSLSLPYIYEGYPEDFLGSFLRSHVPNLERLCIPTVHGLDDEADVRRLEEAIAVGCPRLQHLSSDWDNDTTDGEEESKQWGAFNAFLRGCIKAGLRTYQNKYFMDERYSQGSIIESLLQYHGRTLEEIAFLDFHGVDSENIVSILTTCKSLRKLRMEPYGEAFYDLRFGDVLTEWVCRDITSLNLALLREADVPEDRTEDEVLAEAAQRVYTQIGRLFKLEELKLYCYQEYSRCLNVEESCAYDLMLERGWLGKLAGLKRLRHFEMGLNYWYYMGQAEVEFMDANWPKLRSIKFSCMQDNMLHMLQDDHWKWLKERRPHIDLGGGWFKTVFS